MYLARNKRMKFQNGDKNYSYFDHRDEEELTPSKVIDYSDAFALSKFLAELDEGKYGSVTKEYENLHAQRLQVINLLSALRPALASPCASQGLKLTQVGFSSPSSRRHQVNPDQNNVIDLDVDPSVDVSSDHHSTSKELKDSTSVIILDSDEEDGDHQIRIKDSSSSGNAPHITQAWLESELQILRRKAMLLAREGNSNHLVPYEERNARLNHDVVEGRRQPSIQYEKVVFRAVTEKYPIQDLVNQNDGVGGGRIEGERFHLEVKTDKVSDKKKYGATRGQIKGQGLLLEVKTNKKSDKQNYGVAKGQIKGDGLHPELKTDKESDASPSPIPFVGMQDHTSSIEIHNAKETPESDGLEDLWKDMSLAMEYSKGATSADGSTLVPKGEDCIHSFLLEDDLGLVCRICGVIQKSIDTIFDFQWTKGVRSTRTYMPGSRHPKDDDTVLFSGSKASERDLIAADIFIHPRHMKQMRPHQIEGFNFLVRNLVADKPGGCILAHAPGSGKTFMLISFIQSFLAKYPSSRPLVILPKGILATWKKEFQLWQVEDTPLYDFYSTNATSRAQQLDILRSWEENRSILFLGYKQFANIVCGGVTNKIAAACQERLLKVPGLLILDEGHTPRNESTDVLNSLAKVQTPRKVVLSGTLFQNHVREVFNILNLVRPKFLKMESSRSVVKRVLSRVHISGTRRPYKGSLDAAFYDLVEDTLQNDDNYKRKVTVIQDLRELTSTVLHYYRGDFLDELPGLSDFTVLLNLSAKQKELVQKLGTFEKFKKSAVGSAVYIHPYLKDVSEHAAGDRGTAFSDEKIDSILDSINVRDGVKTKFFLNILSMCESAGEKLLVFSQYLLPLKFLERLVVRMKGWRVDKEIFMISGDSSPDHREWSMDQFNSSVDAKVFFGSIKACGEGISLVGASRVVILDVHLNPSVTRQAIGRAFRPGQKKKLYTYRLVASDSPEEEDHYTSFRKELIAKMWFEWSQYSGSREFELDEVDISNSEDPFLENPVLAEDVKALYRR